MGVWFREAETDSEIAVSHEVRLTPPLFSFSCQCFDEDYPFQNISLARLIYIVHLSVYSSVTKISRKNQITKMTVAKTQKIWLMCLCLFADVEVRIGCT